MSKLKCMNVRFNLDKEDHLKAWEYLLKMTDENAMSRNQAVIELILERFDKKDSKGGSVHGPGSYDDQLIEAVSSAASDAVMNSIESFLPVFMAGCLAGLNLKTVDDIDGIKVPMDPSETAGSDVEAEIEESGLDMGFLGIE